MLAHLGGDYGVASRNLIDFFDNVLRLYQIASLTVGKRVFFLPLGYLIKPWSTSSARSWIWLFFCKLYQLLERILAVADDGNVDVDVFADTGRINVDVDDLGIRGKGADLSGYTIVKAHPDRKDNVRMGYSHVSLIGAVHPEHSPARSGLGRLRPFPSAVVAGKQPRPIREQVTGTWMSVAGLGKFLRCL